MSKSCESCVHRSDAPELDGLPVCSKHTMPLALSTSTDAHRLSLLNTIAEACDDHKFGRPERTNVRFPGYCVGANPTLAASATESPTGIRPKSCTRCEYWAPAETVLSELGWSHGMCTLKAELIPAKRTTEVATVCSFGRTGANAPTTAGLILNPAYSGFSMVREPKVSGVDVHTTRAQAADFHISVDPRKWETDLPVEDDIKAAGIRAWRKVTDPTGYGADAYMPIFDHTHPDFAQFDADGELIDPRDTYGDLTPHLYQDYAGLLYTFVRLSMGGIDPSGGLQQTLCYVGESGTGKTEFAGYVAYLMNLPLTRISVRPSLLGDDLFGSPELTTDEHGNNVTRWVDGVFTHAYTRAGVLLLDEPNAANDDVWMMLRPALDKGRVLTIEKLNRRLNRHWANFIVLAMNPAHSASYRGTRELSLADKRRFRQIHVPMPDPDTEAKIIKSHCAQVDYEPAENLIKTIVAIGNEFRQMYASGDLPESWGVRENIAVAELTCFFPMEQAYRLAALDSMETKEADQYLMVINSKLGRKRG